MSNLSQALEEVVALFPKEFKPTDFLNEHKRRYFLKGFDQAYKGVLDGKVKEAYFNTTDVYQFIVNVQDDKDFEYFGFGVGYVAALLKNRPREFLADKTENDKLIKCLNGIWKISISAQGGRGYTKEFKMFGPDFGASLNKLFSKYKRAWSDVLMPMYTSFSKEERKNFDEMRWNNVFQ
ncbi:hypothetical protein HYW20_07115 [Candidatus Woesearchaeota archaeon]|nr:hypothetical protein [Candidatus Woesearchaeota archaeon]